MKDTFFKLVGTTIVTLIILLPAALVGLVSSVIRGLVLCKLWSWFVVATFSAPELGACSALGLALLVNYVTWQNAVTPKIEAEDVWDAVKKVVFEIVATPLTVLFIGWIFHLFQ